jgi:hypothetical protein
MARDARHATTYFRASVWPGQMAVPHVDRWTAQVAPLATQRGEVAALGYDGSDDATVELPDELALRQLAGVDDTDPDALCSFASTFGALTALSSDPTTLLPNYVRRQFVADPASGVAEAIDRNRKVPDTMPPIVWAPVPLVSHHVRAVRAIAAHWFAAQRKDDAGIVAAWDGVEFPYVWSDDEAQCLSYAWARWQDYVAAALAPVTAHVRVQSCTSASSWRDLPGWERPTVTAYSAMVLQIVNDVEDSTPWKVCANEQCGRVFGRQQGRANVRNRTVGVTYCSASCARAQGQRNRRKEQREGRDLQQERPTEQ